MSDLLFLDLRRQRKERKFRVGLHIDDFTDEELRARFRFGRNSILFITNLLAAELRRNTQRNHALTPQLQVLIALRFYASGSFLQVIGDTFGVDKSTVSRAITHVSQALTAKTNFFIKWPANAELCNIKNGFYRRGGFPSVIGCVDGTHVRLQAPSEHENTFVNRKGFHSINVQGICSHEEENHRSLDDGVLLGDSGYACSPYLMTPYANPATPEQEAYNQAHSKTRVIIEQTFGRWKRRFHVLHSEIRMAPTKVCSIIGACAVLHNIALQRGEPMEDVNDQEELAEIVVYNGPQQGLALRDHVCHTFFG